MLILEDHLLELCHLPTVSLTAIQYQILGHYLYRTQTRRQARWRLEDGLRAVERAQDRDGPVARNHTPRLCQSVLLEQQYLAHLKLGLSQGLVFDDS